jgi:hypothetical protein
VDDLPTAYPHAIRGGVWYRGNDGGQREGDAVLLQYRRWASFELLESNARGQEEYSNFIMTCTVQLTRDRANGQHNLQRERKYKVREEVDKKEER